MGRRWQHLVSEVAKFLAVGGLATLIALALFNVLVHGYFGGPGPMHGHALWAYLIANTIGMLVSYRGSRSWAFRHREAVGPAGGRLAYFGINTVTMVLPISCLWFSRNILGLDNALSDNLAANVIGLALGMMARFFLFRRFVFRHPARGEPVPVG